MIQYQRIYGGVAHLVERLNGIQEVVGSIPIVSTIHPVTKDKESRGAFICVPAFLLVLFS